MGRFYSLRVPSNIEGVSTSIDVSMGPINHIAFDRWHEQGQDI